MVEPVTNQDGSQSYKIAVAAKNGVPPFGPFLPFPAILPKSPETRQFLLTKSTPFLFYCLVSLAQ